MGLVRPEERLTLGRRAAQRHPEDGVAWLILGETLQDVPESWDEQAQAYQKAMLLLPDNPTAFNNLAWMYLQRGRALDALPLALSAVRMAPWESSMLDTLAGALAALGRCSEAQAIQTRAIDLLPERASHARAWMPFCGSTSFRTNASPGSRRLRHRRRGEPAALNEPRREPLGVKATSAARGAELALGWEWRLRAPRRELPQASPQQVPRPVSPRPSPAR